MSDKEYNPAGNPEDAEIEAEFQRCARQVQAASARKVARRRAARFVGFPWEFLTTVRDRISGADAQTLALYVYHRTRRCKAATVTLIGAELTELKVAPGSRHKALAALAAAGIIRLHKVGPGRSTRVELLWSEESYGSHASQVASGAAIRHCYSSSAFAAVAAPALLFLYLLSHLSYN
jgi:hypothetical protein